MTTINYYEKGDLVRASGAFTNVLGEALDPTTVIFQFKDPTGSTTSYTYGAASQVVKDSTGNYHVDVDASAVGTWYYRFYSTGTGQAADEGKFIVEPSAF